MESKTVKIGGRVFDVAFVRAQVNEVLGNVHETMKGEGGVEVVGMFTFFQHSDGRITISSGGAICPGDLASSAIGRAFAIESHMTLENLSKCLMKPEEAR